MYLTHYHLKVKPFQINPDPRFLWLGESHRQSLAMFKDGIAENKGLILLIGDVGTGKTTLINGLLNSLDENTLVASVQYPGFDILDFYNYLATCFNMGKKYSNKGDFLVHFIHFLHEEYTQNKKILLIIDEAQGLSDEILDEIRLLSNLERMKTKLLNIFLVGQDEMDTRLAEPDMKFLAQSIAAKFYLGPLKKQEVREYINFRLRVAGAEYRIFNKGAIREIVENSKCNPRLINAICDHALFIGYTQGKSRIDEAVIKECAKELYVFKKV
jgi:general secretion pathway protein A